MVCHVKEFLVQSNAPLGATAVGHKTPDMIFWSFLWKNAFVTVHTDYFFQKPATVIHNRKAIRDMIRLHILSAGKLAKEYDQFIFE
jgi:hypothetical protein